MIKEKNGHVNKYLNKIFLKNENINYRVKIAL